MKWYDEIHANSRKTDQTDRLRMMLLMLMLWLIVYEEQMIRWETTWDYI
jgi:hypothetical protein